MSCLKDLFTGMRARDVVFMSGYALYLTFGYMSFESPTVLTSLGESGAIVQSLFLVAVIAARMVVYAAMIALARRSGRGFSTAVVLVCAGVAATGFIVTRMAFRFAEFVPLNELVPWLVAGGLCFGAGDALINLLWARFSGTFDLRRVYLFVLLSSGLSLIVYFVVTLLPAALMLPAGVDRRQRQMCIRDSASASPRASPSTRSSPRRCSRARCRCCGVRCLARQSWRS